MKRIVLWLASTVTIVVLLFGYHTSTNDVSATTAPSSAIRPSPSTSSTPSSPSRPTSSSSSTRSQTYTGAVASTRWGPVQVQITVTAENITDVTVLQQPNGNRKDAEINARALPILVQDTLSAQSAQIDMVSGATVTSEGYVHSLQAALDQAGI